MDSIRSPQPASRLDFFYYFCAWVPCQAAAQRRRLPVPGVWRSIERAPGMRMYVTASSTHIPTAAVTCKVTYSF